MMQDRLYGPFTQLSESILITANALGAAERIFDIFDTAPDVADRPGALSAPRFQGEIRFEAVSFFYPKGRRRVIEGLSLSVPSRTTLALVGPSGGGKTTIVSLLNRFYDPVEGRVLIDGWDVRDCTVRSLRGQIGLVPQDPVLFAGTVEENIFYGRPEATEEEMADAARKAYALEFISELDGGFKAVIGERGIKLSAGQKQRIAIARAFLKNPAILVLDEATSALDSESERLVQKAVGELLKDRTAVIIAHRLSTVIRADNIAVIESGRLLEQGTHAELLRRGGLYARLCEVQFSLTAARPRQSWSSGLDPSTETLGKPLDWPATVS
jgi:subfamily B ATP-binding cassette protein MsbA